MLKIMSQYKVILILVCFYGESRIKFWRKSYTWITNDIGREYIEQTELFEIFDYIFIKNTR